MPVIDLAHYTLQKSTTSSCKHCNTPVHLLCAHENSLNQDLPMFYLCENCGQIHQAGKGPLNLPEKCRSTKPPKNEEPLEERKICISCCKAIATQQCAKCRKWFCISCVAISAGRGCEEHIRCMKCYKEEHPTKKTEAEIQKWEKRNATPPNRLRSENGIEKMA